MVDGTCDARFAAVRDALAENLCVRDELGAAVAVVVDGRLVVDVWGGWADVAQTRPWRRNTLVDVFSVGKPIAALAALRLVEDGRATLDAPLARWWPAFAAAGKEAVTLRMLLAHRAGLPGIRTPLPDGAMYDWDRMAAALAAEAPWWPPGTAHGYHVNTFGFLVGEAVRRIGGTTIDAAVRRDVTGPLDADFRFGVSPADTARVAEYEFATGLFAASEPEPPSPERRALLQHIYLNPPGISGIGTVNAPAWRAAVMPSTNGHATARAVARVYDALARGGTRDGVRIVAPETLALATAEASAGVDLVLQRPSRYGLGFQLSHAESPLGHGPRAFGHAGAGGAIGFADPDARLAFAYVMNRSGPRWRNPRTRALIDAVYSALV